MMNMYRRNDFKSWFADVGFMYVIVSAVVGLVFLLSVLISFLLPSTRVVERIPLFL